MQTENWDDYPVSGLPYGEYPEVWSGGREETGGDTTDLADSEADWCDSEYDSYVDDCCDVLHFSTQPPRVTYRQPTVLEILKRQGIRAAINYKCERLCVGAFADMHDDARKHGYSLSRPDYKMPWWFKWASRLESRTRPKRK